MDQERTLDTGRIRDAMDQTRASIRDTVEELRDKVGDAVDWRHYVDRFPGASLAVAMFAGMVIGRQIGAMLLGRANGVGQPAALIGHSGSDPGFVTTPRAVEHEPDRRRAATRSLDWSSVARIASGPGGRAGSRLETLVNRVIDELADAAERNLVPAVVARVQGLFASGETVRHAEGHPERRHEAGVYPGGPAGTQAYPMQTRRGTGS
ncbi:MAG: hypothetical protein ACRELA_24645 [Candidatus Rokuibacteriota bacterium]